MTSSWCLAMVVVGCGSSPARVTPSPIGAAPPPDAAVSEMAVPDAAPPAKTDLATELAWAKSRFTNELGSFDMTPHGDELRAWLAPKTELPIFLTSRAG